MRILDSNNKVYDRSVVHMFIYLHLKSISSAYFHSVLLKIVQLLSMIDQNIFHCVPYFLCFGAQLVLATVTYSGPQCEIVIVIIEHVVRLPNDCWLYTSTFTSLICKCSHCFQTLKEEIRMTSDASGSFRICGIAFPRKIKYLFSPKLKTV